MIDVENLDAGQEFRELPDTYVIFITENDFYGEGKAFYRIQRMNLTTGKPFDDGANILYVNGEYRGDDELGKLMHDFNCTDPRSTFSSLMTPETGFHSCIAHTEAPAWTGKAWNTCSQAVRSGTHEEWIDAKTRVIAYNDVDENNSRRKSYRQYMVTGLIHERLNSAVRLMKKSSLSTFDILIKAGHMRMVMQESKWRLHNTRTKDLELLKTMGFTPAATYPA